MAGNGWDINVLSCRTWVERPWDLKLDAGCLFSSATLFLLLSQEEDEDHACTGSFQQEHQRGGGKGSSDTTDKTSLR